MNAKKLQDIFHAKFISSLLNNKDKTYNLDYIVKM